MYLRKISTSVMNYTRNPLYNILRMQGTGAKVLEKAEAPIPELKTIDKNVDIKKQTVIVTPYPVFEETAPISFDTVDKRKVQSFEEIPGPVLLRRVKDLLKYIPMIGTQVTTSGIQYMLSTGTQLVKGNDMRFIKWLFNEYGPVVRLQNPLGGDIVLLSRPEYAKVVFNNEGRYPVRSNLDCIEKYYSDHRRSKQISTFVMNGAEWEILRKQIKVPFDNSLSLYYKKLDTISDEFVERIKNIRNNQDEMPKDFYTEIFKWSMECLLNVAFSKHFGLVNLQIFMEKTEAANLLKSLTNVTTSVQKCERGLQLWKFRETPAWKALTQNCDIVHEILERHIIITRESLRDKKQVHQPTDGVIMSKEASLVEHLLIKEGLTTEEVLAVVFDMMLIGVNFISHAVSFLLYHLARCPRAQKKLFDEMKTFSDANELNLESLVNMKYLQACVKESLRLKPPMPVLTRVLTHDITVNNYHVPSGTYLMLATHVFGLGSEYFEDSLKFRPERWFDGSTDNMHVLASIPFGYGVRSCFAQSLSEMQIALMASKLIKNFHIDFPYGDIGASTKLLAMPDRPLKFRFADRY